MRPERNQVSGRPGSGTQRTTRTVDRSGLQAKQTKNSFNSLKRLSGSNLFSNQAAIVPPFISTLPCPTVGWLFSCSMLSTSASLQRMQSIVQLSTSFSCIFVCVQPYSTTLFGVPFPLPTPQGAGIGNSGTSPRPRFEG